MQGICPSFSPQALQVERGKLKPRTLFATRTQKNIAHKRVSANLSHKNRGRIFICQFHDMCGKTYLFSRPTFQNFPMTKIAFFNAAGGAPRSTAHTSEIRFSEKSKFNELGQSLGQMFDLPAQTSPLPATPCAGSAPRSTAHRTPFLAIWQPTLWAKHFFRHGRIFFLRMFRMRGRRSQEHRPDLGA